MKNIHEWRVDSAVGDGEVNEFKMNAVQRGLGAGATERYASVYYTTLARRIDWLTQNRLDDATREDPTVTGDPAKLNLIKQEILRDIVAVATNVVANGLKGSRTATNFRKVGTNLA